MDRRGDSVVVFVFGGYATTPDGCRADVRLDGGALRGRHILGEQWHLDRFTKVGRTVSLNFFFEDTTTGSGMGTQLRIKMPFGMKAAATTYMGPLIVRGSVNTEGYVTAEGTDTLYCYRTDHAAWPSSITDNLDIRGSLTCQVTD